MKTLVILLVVLISSCSSSKPESDLTKDYVNKNYRITEDRKQFDEFRQNQSDEVKIENDESSYMANLFSDLTKSPMQIRNEFDSKIRKKRTQFEADTKKQRDLFNKSEQKKREAFAKIQSERKKEFSRTRHNADESKDFYNELEENRRDFNSDLKAKRDDFESEAREKRKNFDEYIRSKNTEFNTEYKSFTMRQQVQIKIDKEQKDSAAKKRKELLQMEFDNIDELPAKKLETE